MSCLKLAWAAILAVLLVLIGAHQAEAEAEGFGPLPVRNFQPLQLLFLNMPGAPAAVLKKGTLDVRVELAVTNMIASEETNPPFFALVRATMNLETERSALFLRYGLTSRLEVGLEIPAIYRYGGGALNGLITAVERATGGLSGTRQAVQGIGYAYNVSKNGQTLFAGGEDQFGLGDISLHGKYLLLTQTERLPAVSLRVAVKAPTGNSSQLFGSGEVDLGIGLAIEKAVRSTLVFYGNVNGVFPTGKVAGLTLQPFITSIVGLEYLWSPGFSITAQFDYYSSPYYGTGIKVLDRGVTEVAAGFNYRLRNNLLWQVYGIQNVDLITGAAADFTLSTVVTYRFPR
jgi:hypothetical protein